MAALFDALKTLSPTTVAELPSADNLPGYLVNCLQDTHVLINSLPPPSVSSCQLPSDPSLESLQKEWKAVKLGAKENPMGFSVYKLTAKDGRGSWFARRSVHEELGFRKFRAGLMREFEYGIERGSSVRGLGRERQVEKERCSLGQVEANYLTAQFPGPSAPRDFVVACLTSSTHPDDLVPSSSSESSGTRSRSSSSTTEASDGSKPRQFTMISRPLKDHPECGERQGYVRGQFESVEFIREIPAICHPPINRRSMDTELKRVQSVPNVSILQEEEEERVGRKRGRTITFADGSVPGGEEILSPQLESSSQLHPEQNPVEWIMITRSDPGGSVPRWLVERGTPGGIVKDAEKFLDWAAKKEDLGEDYPDEAEYEETMEGPKVGDLEDIKEGTLPGQQVQVESKRGISGSVPGELERSNVPETGTKQGETGLLSSAISTVSAGVSMLAPSVIISSSSSTTPSNSETTTLNNENIPPSTKHSTGANTPETDPDYIDDDDTGSINSFATARSNELEPDTNSLNSTSTNPSASHHRTHEEKALARLLREKSKLTEKLERQRSRERKKRSKDDEREQKLLEKHMKEVEKREARYNKDIEKARRREEKRKAKELTKEQREVEELKKVVEGLTKENLELKERVEFLEGRERVKEAEAAVIGGGVGEI